MLKIIKTSYAILQFILDLGGYNICQIWKPICTFFIVRNLQLAQIINLTFDCTDVKKNLKHLPYLLTERVSVK